MAEVCTLSDHDLITRSDAAIASEVEGKAVILDIESGMFFQMNDVGSQIWWELESPIALRALCLALERRFEVSAEICRREVVEFVTGLSEKGLVQVSKA